MYRIQPLAGPTSVHPGDGSVIPFGINAAGDVAGSSSAWLWHSSSPEPVLALMGTLWQGAALSFTQPWNPSNSSILYALNAAGDAVGVRAIENTSTAHGEFVRGGIAYDLSSAVGAGSFVRGINDAGLACGWSMARPDAFVYDTHTGAVVSWIAPLPGTSKARAYGINHLGRVVGVSDTIAFVADGGGARGLGPASFVGGINDAGTVCGSIGKPTPQNYAPAICDANAAAPTFVEIPVPQGFLGAHATAINNHGVVVGSCWRAGSINTAQSAYVYHDGGASTDLNTLVAVAGWHLEYATSVNDAGQIVGYGTFQGRRMGFLLTPRELPPDSWKLGHKWQVPDLVIPWPWPPRPEPPMRVEKRDALWILALEELAHEISDANVRETVRRELIEAARQSLENLAENITNEPASPTPAAAPAHAAGGRANPHITLKDGRLSWPGE